MPGSTMANAAPIIHEDGNKFFSDIQDQYKTNDGSVVDMDLEHERMQKVPDEFIE